jgi:pyruvate kinase
MGRQLILHRGIYPVVGLDNVAEADRAKVAMQEAQNLGYVSTGDSVVIVHVDKDFGRSANFKIAAVP